MKSSLKIFQLNLQCGLLALIVWGCTGTHEIDSEDSLNPQAKNAVLEVHQQYVAGWIHMDQTQVMNLFEEESRIQPSSLMPVSGKAQIRDFWFPEDGSVTKINRFETELLGITMLDSLAVTTHQILLDWDYQIDTVSVGRVQRGISTTIYRNQGNNSWKIWRMMWTDLASELK